MTANEGQIAYWNDVAGSKWVANQVRLDRLMAPLTMALTAAAAAQPGERVLDVGCGCGTLALRMAEEVGADGHVIAADISRPMLAHGRTRAMAPIARAPIDWLEADAMVHPFATDRDLMVSRFGVMFFEDRDRAFANLRTALRPGGRFVFLAWRPAAEVEWMDLPRGWIAPVLAPREPVPNEIGPFGLADPGLTRRALEGAGFRDVTADKLDRPLTIGPTVEEALAILVDTGPAGASIREAEEPQKTQAAALLRAELDKRNHGAGIVLGGACWLYSGRA